MVCVFLYHDHKTSHLTVPHCNANTTGKQMRRDLTGTDFKNTLFSTNHSSL